MRVSVLTMPTRSSPTSRVEAAQRGRHLAPRSGRSAPAGPTIRGAQRAVHRVGVLARHLEVHDPGKFAGQPVHAARGPVGAEALGAFGEQADDAMPVGPTIETTAKWCRRASSSVSTTERRIIGARVADHEAVRSTSQLALERDAFEVVA